MDKDKISKSEKQEGQISSALEPQALRALKEAEARRAQSAPLAPKTSEIGGPKGAEPSRYGDWEKNGRAIDF